MRMVTKIRMAVQTRSEHKKAIEQIIQTIDIQDYVGQEVTKMEAIRLEEAKLSMLYWLDTYYSYPLQKVLLQVSLISLETEFKRPGYLLSSSSSEKLGRATVR